MGEFNQLLGVAQRLSRALAVALGQEEQVGITSVAPEVQPSLDLSTLPLEFRKFADDRICFGGQNQGAGGAGTFVKHGLANPSGSGMLLILERIHFSAGASGLSVRLDVPLAGATTLPRGFRDTRLGLATGQVPVGVAQVLSSASTPGLNIGTIPQGVASTAYHSIEFPFVIAPNHCLILMAGNNEAASVEWQWRERPGSPRELDIVSL